MTDIKQLQDGLMLVINLLDQQTTLIEALRTEIQSLDS